MLNRRIILVVHDVRSCHNVGSLMRTSDGLGVEKIFLTGYTPYPAFEGDTRLPHLVKKVDARIRKTALGAEKCIDWEWNKEIAPVVKKLRSEGFHIVALEQTEKATTLNKFRPPPKIALIVGSEIGGISGAVLDDADTTLHIPMLGKKESFNVSAAAAMALYHFRFTP